MDILLRRRLVYSKTGKPLGGMHGMTSATWVPVPVKATAGLQPSPPAPVRSTVDSSQLLVMRSEFVPSTVF